MNSKVISSVFLIAGCAMGAGCLALPFLASGPGFVLSSLFIIICAMFSYFLAKYSLEAFILYKNGANSSTVVSKSFGKYGMMYNNIINILLMYAILTVYLSGGANLIQKVLLPYLHINISSTAALFVFMILGYLVFIRGTSLVVKSNSAVFTVKLISLLLALGVGVIYFKFNIINYDVSNFPYLFQALPIFFAALGFHMAIPIVAEINDYDRVKCNKILKYTVTAMALLYIMWIAVTFSLIPRTGNESFFQLISQHKSVGDMINLATHNNHHLPLIMVASLNIFSSIALITSFLSIGVSLYEYWRDALKIKQNIVGINYTFLLTMLPPFIFALFYPNGFVLVLEQAAIILILTIITPVLVTLKNIDKIEGYKPSKIGLHIVLFVCVALIILQVLDNFSCLPEFGIS